MKIKRLELLEALEIVRPGLATGKEVIEQSSSFAFRGGRVITYNDEISIAHKIEGMDLEGAIKAEELYQLLGKIKAEEISIATTDNELRIKAGRSRAGIKLQTEIKLPLDEISEIGDWEPIPEDLIPNLSMALPCVGREASRPVLQNIHIRKDGKVEASDSLRAIQCVGTELPIPTCLIPGSTVRELIHYPLTEMSHNQGWLHFKTKQGTIISCRTVNDNYVNVDEVIHVKGEEIHLPDNLGEILEKAAIFVKGDKAVKEEVEIRFAEGKMVIRGEGNYGWFQEQADLDYKGEEVTITVNPTMLKTIASKVKRCVLGENSMRFDGESWIYIVALTTMKEGR
jgi:DNA polymerase III sliding clamp (beta) subunit (PCNA family)